MISILPLALILCAIIFFFPKSYRSGRGLYWSVLGATAFFFGFMLYADIVDIDDPVASSNTVAMKISAVFLLLFLCVSVARLIDAGISRWWALVLAIPLVNIIAAIVFGMLKSDDGNRIDHVS